MGGGFASVNTDYDRGHGGEGMRKLECDTASDRAALTRSGNEEEKVGKVAECGTGVVASAAPAPGTCHVSNNAPWQPRCGTCLECLF
jgi:hypothetical protein